MGRGDVALLRNGRFYGNRALTDAERVQAFGLKVEPSATRSYDGTPCLEWVAAKKRDGYGLFAARPGRVVLAHRWAYERWVGPIPEGLTLDHLCVNPACVNVLHLEPVMGDENARRSAHGRPKHGTWSRYRKGCHCAECLPVGRARERERRAKSRAATRAKAAL